MLHLRDYQTKCVSDIRQSYIDGCVAPLLVMPTGSGKTVVFSHIATNTSRRGKKVLILVHRIELLRQTSEALRKSGVHHGLINPRHTPDLTALVQVASVQTVIRRMDWFSHFDLIIIDEAHHALAATWKKIIEKYAAARLLGVTATPCRSDGTGLGVHVGGVFDVLIAGPTVPDLIAQGFLVKPVIYAPAERLDLSGIRTKMGDYDTGQLADLMDRPTITGDIVQHYRRLCHGVPGVTFCVNVKHAEHMAEEFRRAGYRSYSVDGSMDDGDRRRILAGLGNGTVDMVTSCDLISEGTDIPAIGAAILARPTQSMGLFLQQVGRALRIAEGKTRAVILDHVGNCITHGLPDEVREWTLDGEPKRKKGKKDQERKVQVRQCQQCYAIHEPAPVCPICGYVYIDKDPTPKQVDGDLREISLEDRLKLRRNKVNEVGRATTIEQLDAIARERGYKPGWATHIFNSRKQKSHGNF